MTQDEEIRRGMRAEELMQDPLLIEAFSEIENGVISAMKRVAIGDEKAHRELIYMLQVIGSVKNHFQQVIQTGKMARLQAEESKAKKLLRRVVG